MGILSFLSKPEEEKVLSTRHPYYPTDLKLTNYTEPTHSTAVLLISFVIGLIVISGISLAVIIPKKTVESNHKPIFLWFIITGSIHFFFEGYFALYHENIAENNGLFAQMWKEYALSDSRYLTSDPFVVIMESITAVCWGPLSFLTAYAIYENLPFRYTLQIIVSLGQLYGLVLYYLTELMEGAAHCRPEAYYFWGYFFGVNFIWAILSVTLIRQGWHQISNFAKNVVRKKDIGVSRELWVNVII
ncbi:14074_t:CDS:2 [Dentiscutata erythropus]|uniref:14074_t:CDS:1 n=1 Tax=Dentiscutata erythropus TaxID=1348616 RepID=A0A9N9BEH7_9GLOM|nr:14074_t:CDS:2 [Dentiscutata erythropus]